MRNRHTDSKKFMPGKSLPTYRGRMKHDPSTEAIKDSLHTQRGPAVVQRHGDCPSVGTETIAQASARGATTFGGKNGS
jgi:hypothetical protein